MRKWILILVVLITYAAQPAIAQKNIRTTAWNHMKYSEWIKARDAINQAVKHEQTINDVTTWQYRGQIYIRLYETKDPEIRKAEPDSIAALKEAFNSFKKAAELEAGLKNTTGLTEEGLYAVALYLFNEATSFY